MTTLDLDDHIVRVVTACAKRYGVPPLSISSKRKTEAIANARFVAALVLRETLTGTRQGVLPRKPGNAPLSWAAAAAMLYQHHTTLITQRHRADSLRPVVCEVLRSISRGAQQ